MIIIDPKEYWTKRYEEAGEATVWLNNKYRPETHQKRLEFIGERLPSNSLGTVLDFGCGTGAYSRLFNKDLYIGYDHMEAATKIAEKNNPGFRYTNSQTQYGYMTLFTNCVLQHNPYEEVVRILEKYGNRNVVLYECTDSTINSGHCEGRIPLWYENILDRRVTSIDTHHIDGAEHSLMIWLQE